jgi:hypothetical protein
MLASFLSGEKIALVPHCVRVRLRWSWKTFVRYTHLGFPSFPPIPNLLFSISSINQQGDTFFLPFPKRIKKSEDFGSTLIAYMYSISTLFTKVNEQISYLPSSVSRFDSTVRGLNQGIIDQQQEFQKSISELQSNIDAFSKGIEDYGKSLAEIVVASDKQLSLLDKRQELLEKELMRKPKLILRVKQCTKDTLERDRLTITPEILNVGNAIAEYCRILIMVPQELDFSSSGFMVYDSTKKTQAWSYNVSGFIGYSPGKEYYPLLSHPRMRFSIKVSLNFKSPCQLDYVIYHNKGEDEGKLVINLHDCK